LSFKFFYTIKIWNANRWCLHSCFLV